MSPTNSSPSLLHMLQQQLDAARAHDASIRAQNTQGSIIQVPGTGKAISSAYEQLRNAAENAEEHLLLQRAIKRFFNRNFSFFTKRHGQVGNVGYELIVELTQAGYIHSGDYGTETAERIRTLAEDYMHTYGQLREAHVPRDDAIDWVLSILSVEVEGILSPHSRSSALAYTAYQHYLQILPKDTFATNPEEAEKFEISLYVAVHQALLKSDIGIVRHDLMRMYKQTPQHLAAFIQFNRTVNDLYLSNFTHRLKRVVSKYGAPLRILKSMTEDRDDLPELLQHRENFLDTFERQTQHEYKQVNSRLNKGIIRSVIFLLMTKVVIGVGIEVPYDLIVVGQVALLPLIINLLFPPLYMASLKLGLKVPSLANAHALREYIDKAVYGNEAAVTPTLRDAVRTVSNFSKWLYAVLFLIPFAVMLYALKLLDFNIVQAIIFFTFLSTASFLGFRLSRMIRELEIVTHQSNFLATIRDFFYLPFILVGQWLSGKYAKINAVGYFLDIAIELPLKTVLKLVRQWTRFLHEKHEELY